MKRLVFIGALLLAPSVAMAAYQNPTVEAVERKSDGGGRIVFKFTGNAGEPVVMRTYIIQAGSTVNGVRNWVDDTLNELNLVQAAAGLPGLQQGQTVTRLARVTPAKAAKQAWREDFELYLHIKDSGIAAIASYVTTLKARVEANYQAGFLDE